MKNLQEIESRIAELIQDDSHKDVAAPSAATSVGLTKDDLAAIRDAAVKPVEDAGKATTVELKRQLTLELKKLDLKKAMEQKTEKIIEQMNKGQTVSPTGKKETPKPASKKAKLTPSVTISRVGGNKGEEDEEGAGEVEAAAARLEEVERKLFEMLEENQTHIMQV